MTAKTAQSVMRAIVSIHPNTITLFRLAAVPAVVLLLMVGDSAAARFAAFVVFAIAAATDALDGYVARSTGRTTALGKMLDPIADKLLVGGVIVMLVADRTIAGPHVLAAVVIISREILVSGLRELLATLDRLDRVSVTQLAKWKTVVQLVALGLLILAPAVGTAYAAGIATAGLALLWAATAITFYTGYNYFMAGVRDIQVLDRAREAERGRK